MLDIIMIIIAYLIGSITTGLLVAKLMKLPDPREGGSGNIGATNMLRIGGKNAALFTLGGDVLKGFIPVMLASILGVQGFMLAVVALAAMAGHVFPAFNNFQGGKGVATMFGGLLVLSFGITLVAIVVWIGIVALTRYVSLASMASLILAAVLFLFGMPGYFLPVAVMVILLLWKHMDNIQRLRTGTESKFEWK